MQKTVKMTVKGKISRKWASGFMNLKKSTPRGILILSRGYIHVYDLNKQTSLLVYISDLR